jgi:hypothetical protein
LCYAERDCAAVHYSGYHTNIASAGIALNEHVSGFALQDRRVDQFEARPAAFNAVRGDHDWPPSAGGCDRHATEVYENRKDIEEIPASVWVFISALKYLVYHLTRPSGNTGQIFEV